MVSENTHLFAANKILNQIKNQHLKKFIESNIDYYYLGSIVLDSFAYSREEEIKKFSSQLHGDTGIPTNTIVFKVLDNIKGTQRYKDLAFIFGYLTHCALDLTFHPVINSLARKNTEGGTEKFFYQHWQIETYLDKKYNPRFYLDKLIKAPLVQNLVFSEVIQKEVGIPNKELVSCLKRHKLLFRLFRSNYLVFQICSLLSKLGLFEKKYVAGFHQNLNRDKIIFPKTLNYKDLTTGKGKKTTFDNLLQKGTSLGEQMIAAAYQYHLGKISKKEARKIITGHNLGNGKRLE